MKLTELLAMPIINLRTACPVGVISGFVADDKLHSIAQCIIIDDNTYAEELLYPWGSLRQGADAYCLVGTQVQTLNGVRVPFKSMLYTTDGVCVGMLQDVECTESGKVQNLLLTDGSSIDPTRIYKVGEVIILKGTRKVPRAAKSTAKPDTADASPVNSANPLPQSPTAYFALPQQENRMVDTAPLVNENEATKQDTATLSQSSVTAPLVTQNADTPPQPTIVPLVAQSANTTPQPTATPQDTQPTEPIAAEADTPMVQTVAVPPNGIALRPTPAAVSPAQNDVPYRLVTDYDFLLGRTLTKDLVQSGHVFIAKGTVIDDYAVQLAGRAGLLVALTTISR